MTTASATGGDQRLRSVSPLRLFLSRPEFGAIVGAIIVFLIFAILSVARGDVGKGFLSVQGAASYLEIAAQVGILGAAVSLLMIAGEFDLSVGSMIGASGLLLGLLIVQYGVPPTIAIVLTFAFALAVGAFNGWLRIKTGLPSFIVTLGMLLILRGAGIGFTRAITSNTIVSGVNANTANDPIVKLFTSSVTIGGGEFKVVLLWWIVAVVVATWVLTRTRFGNWIFAVGGAAQSSRAVGVPVNLVKIGLFMTVGFLAWFSGMHLLFSFNTVQSGEGVGNEFLYIIAAVIGGCLLTGGFGSAIGSAIGAFIFGMATQGIVYAGWNPDWFRTFLGIMLLLATVTNLWVRQTAARR